MLYKYHAKDKTGLVTGTMDAGREADVAKLLRQKGLFIVDIQQTSQVLESISLKLPFTGVSFGDIVNFTRQLSTMITAGLPLIDSLGLLATQSTKQSLKDVLIKVVKKVESGGNLSGAFSEYPDSFSKIYTSSIRAGETSGKLDVVLQKLADTLEKEREFRGKIKGAMIYPVIILIGMGVMIFLMMTLVIPKLTEFFQNFQMELPLPTKILIFVSGIFSHFWWLILLCLFALFFLFSSWKRNESGKIIWDKILFRIPVWGPLRREMMLSEMTRTMALLAESGVPILEGLQIIADSVDSPSYSSGIKTAASRVEKGYALGISLSDNPIFPPLLGQMVTVGEETGKMDETLFRVSRFYETSAEEKVKILTTAIEPIIIVLLGVGVAFVVLSVVLPMYQVTQGI